MALAVSIALVFGTFALLVGNMGLSDSGLLGPGIGEMIHAPFPWFVLAAMAGGAALGIGSLVRSPRWFKWPVVLLESLVAAAVIWYVASFSWLPERELAVSVGDAFPAYSLAAHDGSRREFRAADPADLTRRLYIFYRGDW